VATAATATAATAATARALRMCLRRRRAALPGVTGWSGSSTRLSLGAVLDTRATDP
jgi:hypothetical protein